MAGLKGLDQIRQNLAKIAKEGKGAIGAALYQEALAVDALAVEKCPVDTGRLRSTHYVTPPMEEGGKVRIEIGFGTGYAVHVHEQTENRHPVGESKFLEKAFDERSGGFLARLAARARQNLADGVSAIPIGAPTRPAEVSGPDESTPKRDEHGRFLARKTE